MSDSTSVNLYKLAAAALDARPGRTVIVTDDDNFPTDRYVLAGLAAARGLELRVVESDLDAGVSADAVEAALGPDTALVSLSHVAYRSGAIADMHRITRAGEAERVATLAGGSATCVHVHEGTVFVGGDDARLWRLREGELEPVASFERAPTRPEWHTPWGGPPSVFSMASHGDDLYVGVHVGGILRSADGGETWTDTIDLHVDVHQVVVDPRTGTVWAATEGGLSWWSPHLRQRRWTTVTSRHGLPADSLYQIFDDGRGFLWLTSNRGVARIAKAALAAFAAGRGGDPAHPGVPCAGNALGELFAALGTAVRAPVLLHYAENDRYFGPKASREWFGRFTAGGARAEYVLQPPFGKDGHFVLTDPHGAPVWLPAVERFLERHGVPFAPPIVADGAQRT